MALRLTEAQLEAYKVRRARENDAPPLPGKLRLRKGRARMGPSPLELALADQIGHLRLPNPAREFKFLADRNFRFDFAWPQQHVAVEVQGMVHRIKGRFQADIEKRALALLAGWRILEVSGREIRSGQAALWLVALLEQ